MKRKEENQHTVPGPCGFIYKIKARDAQENLYF